MPRRKGVSLSDQIGQLRGIAQSMTPTSPPAANRVRRATGEGRAPVAPAIRRATGEGVKMAPNLVEPESRDAARAEAQMRQVQAQAQARARRGRRRMQM
jgi:hypothetical protein